VSKETWECSRSRASIGVLISVKRDLISVKRDLGVLEIQSKHLGIQHRCPFPHLFVLYKIHFFFKTYFQFWFSFSFLFLFLILIFASHTAVGWLTCCARVHSATSPSNLRLSSSTSRRKCGGIMALNLAKMSKEAHYRGERDLI
jgi:hypothetical protein